MKTLKILFMKSLLLPTINAVAQKAEFEELILCAIKAPSGHNTQPWKFRLHESAIEVLPNFANALPVAENHHRKLYVCLGCVVENI